MKETIYVFLDSKHATETSNKNTFEFGLSNPIQIINDEKCHVSLRDFSCLNSIYNINKNNNKFEYTLEIDGTEFPNICIIPEGGWKGEEIATLLSEEFKTFSDDYGKTKYGKIECKWNNNSLKFNIVISIAHRRSSRPREVFP